MKILLIGFLLVASNIVSADVSKRGLKRVLRTCKQEDSWKSEAICFREEIGYMLSSSRGRLSSQDLLRLGDDRLIAVALQGKTGDCIVGQHGSGYTIKSSATNSYVSSKRSLLQKLRNALRNGECNI